MWVNLVLIVLTFPRLDCCEIALIEHNVILTRNGTPAIKQFVFWTWRRWPDEPWPEVAAWRTEDFREVWTGAGYFWMIVKTNDGDRLVRSRCFVETTAYWDHEITERETLSEAERKGLK